MAGPRQGVSLQTHPRWSVVMAYFNEAQGIAETLTSLAAQRVPMRLILVDNGSTDGSADVARAVLARFPHVRVEFLEEVQPGQSHALKRGLAAVDTDLVAIADADTWYPPEYLETAQRVFDSSGSDLVAVMASLVPERPHGLRGALARAHWMGAAWLWPHQNHTSGPAQTFRTAALRAAGGYDPKLWPFVLKDHELMGRLLQLGRQRYDRDLWCISSDRRRDRSLVRWTLWERLVYHLHPSRTRDWFFRDFLGPRFAARGLYDIKLRDRPWELSESPAVAPPDMPAPLRGSARETALATRATARLAAAAR